LGRESFFDNSLFLQKTSYQEDSRLMNTRQRKLELVKGRVLIIGVDIGKYAHVAAVRLADGEIVKNKIFFHNNLSGFELLANQARWLCEQHNATRVVLGLEPTGHYWQSLGYWWEDNVGPVVLVNPMHTNRAKELEDNSPLKSDPKDAEVISGLVADGKYLECHLPRGVFATLRNLVMQRARCCASEGQLINQIHQSVDRIFPELVGVFSSLKVKSYRMLLQRYSDPSSLVSMKAGRLAKQLHKWSRGQLGNSRAEQIIDLAKRSVGIREGAPAINAEIRRLIRRLESVEADRRLIEDEIKISLKQTPGAALLLSIPDFGPMTVASILAHTGDLRAYQHPDQVIKLAGLNLFEISSGQHNGRLRITKRGRPHLRKVLYMAALRASRRVGSFHYYYARLVDNKTLPTVALVALMRKILRVCWTLVKKSEKFELSKLKQHLQKAA
jgi:transposase